MSLDEELDKETDGEEQFKIQMMSELAEYMCFAIVKFGQQKGMDPMVTKQVATQSLLLVAATYIGSEAISDESLAESFINAKNFIRDVATDKYLHKESRAP